MSRAYKKTVCEACGELPHAALDSFFHCACDGKKWVMHRGYAGTAEDRALLEAHSYEKAEDVRGDIYFVSKRGGPILHLYEDGTWTDAAGYFDAERQDESLEAYLAKQDAFMETAGL